MCCLGPSCRRRTASAWVDAWSWTGRGRGTPKCPAPHSLFGRGGPADERVRVSLGGHRPVYQRTSSSPGGVFLLGGDAVPAPSPSGPRRNELAALRPSPPGAIARRQADRDGDQGHSGPNASRVAFFLAGT